MTEKTIYCVDCETKLDLCGLEDEVIEAGLDHEARCDECLKKQENQK